MKVLITGHLGFIAKNLSVALRQIEGMEIVHFSRNDDLSQLKSCTQACDFVFHLAGVNRPVEIQEFLQGNYELTLELINALKKNRNKCPILFASSTQALLDNPYGQSKKAGEQLLQDYSAQSGVQVFIYRFPNVFGKWCKPNYNSVVATFCHQIAHDLPITVNNPSTVMYLVYIDDVVEELLMALTKTQNSRADFCEVPRLHATTLGEIADLIYAFRQSRGECSIPNMSDPFTKKLYSTYLSYLPVDQFAYELKQNIDSRGSFTEFIKTPDRGQISINVSKPVRTKGNHWHHTKNEKFLVVSGNGVIRLRKIDTNEVLEYFVSEDKRIVVDIPIGYVHNLENLGEKDLVIIMWANEPFNCEKPDTYFEEV